MTDCILSQQWLSPLLSHEQQHFFKVIRDFEAKGHNSQKLVCFGQICLPSLQNWSRRLIVTHQSKLVVGGWKPEAQSYTLGAADKYYHDSRAEGWKLVVSWFYLAEICTLPSAFGTRWDLRSDQNVPTGKSCIRGPGTLDTILGQERRFSGVPAV